MELSQKNSPLAFVISELDCDIPILAIGFKRFSQKIFAITFVDEAVSSTFEITLCIDRSVKSKIDHY